MNKKEKCWNLERSRQRTRRPFQEYADVMWIQAKTRYLQWGIPFYH